MEINNNKTLISFKCDSELLEIYLTQEIMDVFNYILNVYQLVVNAYDEEDW